MKKIAFIFFVVITSVIACKKDNPDTQKPEETLDIQKITLTTKEPVIRDNGSILSGGESSIELSKYKKLEYGICYANFSNPTLNDAKFISNGSSGGEFEGIVSEYFNSSPNKTIYIRAFIRDTSNNSIKYGNQVKVENVFELKIIEIKNISVDEFTVDFTASTSFQNVTLGFCFGTSPNPRLESSSRTVYLNSSETGTISLSTEENSNATILPGETYYVRAFAQTNSGEYYSEQKEVLVAGYRGFAGGIVIFDKGKVVDGWRFIEAAPSNLEYEKKNNDGSSEIIGFFVWQCDEIHNTSLNTDTKIGSGLENTLTIKSYCNYVDNAATMANNIKVKGTANWFLPSLDEFKLLYKAQQYNLVNLNIHPFQPEYNIFWTSSQVNSTKAYAVKYNVNNNMQIVELYKYEDNYAWQIRRY